MVVLIECSKISVIHICYCNVQMLLYFSISEFLLDKLIKRCSIVETFLEEEAIDESTFPKLIRFYFR